MEPLPIADVQERLDRLDRDSRIWKSACLALICAIGVVWTEGTRLFVGKSTIETQRLVVRDAEGRIRAQLKADNGGEASLSLFGQDGATLASFNSAADGSALLSLSSKGQLRANLAALSDGSASLNFYDEHQVIANSLYYRPEVQGGLAMRNDNDEQTNPDSTATPSTRLVAQTDQVSPSAKPADPQRFSILRVKQSQTASPISGKTPVSFTPANAEENEKQEDRWAEPDVMPPILGALIGILQ